MKSKKFNIQAIK